MKISVGQYIPGNSVFHRADPRTKIILTLCMMVFVLVANNIYSYIASALFVIIAVFLSKIKPAIIIKGLKTIIIVVIFTTVLNLIFYRGEHILFSFGILTVYYEGLWFSIKMILRIILLVTSASLLTYTTTSVMLTDGLEWLLKPLSAVGIPSGDIAMIMSVALRFIPIFADETDRIIKAQTARGAEFDSGNIIKKAKAFIPVLIPLFISAFRKSDDLATAMEAKCYRGGEGRTRYRQMKFTRDDLILLVFMIAFSGCITAFNILF